ncbi:hypothetical protein NAT51_07295 [Flavobacterium amniphilum]|uniref:hypothetical protein n=1 Tax=Flavobacterium amniphilum TaxID=1834035 RepID=UPI00202A4D33|nr:hypothetical protein [Flavobacterium amniphilum]MCL9805320.1 hypothetical protein [Flavobacterium amniphilum]
MGDSGKITIIARNIKGNANGSVRYDAKKISNTSGGALTLNGKSKGTSYNKAEERKAPVKSMPPTIKVKEIELITALDSGSANDKSGGIQKGMVFGKTYQFRVKSYFDKEPPNKSVVKWMIKYHNLSKNKWEEIHLKAKGEVMKLFVNEKEMCGRFVYVRAYVNDPKTEGELKVWKHNRFRWFDRMIVEEEIEDRTSRGMPWKIDQASTSLCGMACIFYLFAKEKPDGYKKFARDLFRTGVATSNSYTVNPNEVLHQIDPSKKGFPRSYNRFINKYEKMPLIDFITMAGTRNTDNPKYKGGNEEFQAINWPWLMTRLGKKLLGYSTVEIDYYKANKSYLRDFFGSDEKLRILEKDIDKDYRNGYKICLLIDGSMVAFSKESNYSFDDFSEYHWIVYEGGLKYLNSSNLQELDYDDVSNIELNVFTWGEIRNDSLHPDYNIKMPKLKLEKNQFRSNYYAYLKFK